MGLSSGDGSPGGFRLGIEPWVLSSDIRLETSLFLSYDVSTVGLLVDRWRLCSNEPLIRTAFMDSRTSLPLFGMGEFCTGGSGMPLVPRCF